jgi:hypothetical protein
MHHCTLNRWQAPTKVAKPRSPSWQELRLHNVDQDMSVADATTDATSQSCIGLCGFNASDCSVDCCCRSSHLKQRFPDLDAPAVKEAAGAPSVALGPMAKDEPAPVVDYGSYMSSHPDSWMAKLTRGRARKTLWKRRVIKRGATFKLPVHVSHSFIPITPVRIVFTHVCLKLLHVCNQLLRCALSFSGAPTRPI